MLGLVPGLPASFAVRAFCFPPYAQRVRARQTGTLILIHYGGSRLKAQAQGLKEHCSVCV